MVSKVHSNLEILRIEGRSSLGISGTKQKLHLPFCVNSRRSGTQGVGFMEARQEEVLKIEVRAVAYQLLHGLLIPGFL